MVKGEVHKSNWTRPEGKDQHGTEASVVECVQDVLGRCGVNANEQACTEGFYTRAAARPRRARPSEVESPMSVHGSQRATGEIMSGEGE